MKFHFVNDKRNYAVGDEIHVRVHSDNGGYLTLLDLSPDGIITVLHPAKDMDVGKLTPNADKVLPTPGMFLPVNLPAGQGTLRAIITETPIALRRTGDFASSSDNPAIVASIRSALEQMGRNGGAPWTTLTIPYTIHP